MGPRISSSSPGGSTHNSGSYHISERCKHGVLTFDTTPYLVGHSDTYSKEPTIGELKSTTDTPAVTAARSEVISSIPSTDSSGGDNSLPIASVIEMLDGELLHTLASIFSQAASKVETSRRPTGKAGSHSTSIPDVTQTTVTASQSTGNINRRHRSFGKTGSSRSSDSALGILSDAMSQFRDASNDSRTSRHTQGLDDHKFTLIVPFDRALPVLEIVEGIRAEFNLGDQGVQWEYNRGQWEERHRQLEQKAVSHKANSLTSEDAGNSTSNLKGFKEKWKARIARIQPFSLSYADVRIDRIVLHAMSTMWRQWGNNPYHLPPAFYFILFVGLAAWAIGSIVCGYFESMAKVTTGDPASAQPVFWRGVIGAIPALTGITTFLFPPTFCVRYR